MSCVEWDGSKRVLTDYVGGKDVTKDAEGDHADEQESLGLTIASSAESPRDEGCQCNSCHSGKYQSQNRCLEEAACLRCLTVWAASCR